MVERCLMMDHYCSVIDQFSCRCYSAKRCKQRLIKLKSTTYVRLYTKYRYTSHNFQQKLNQNCVCVGGGGGINIAFSRFDSEYCGSKLKTADTVCNARLKRKYCFTSDSVQCIIKSIYFTMSAY